jgi:ABC-type bacteriocin/lantibiotic exporter with double-glycine peptidase domain
MLSVPASRQPDDVSCLPTCIQAVLAFLGREPDPGLVEDWCHLTPLGCDVDLAIQGLNDAGIDAELRQCESLGELEEMLSEGQPPVAILTEGDGWSHSVVVCALDSKSVTVMDPRLGAYTRIPRGAFLNAWSALGGETLLVGGAPPPAPSAPVVGDG